MIDSCRFVIPTRPRFSAAQRTLDWRQHLLPQSDHEASCSGVFALFVPRDGSRAALLCSAGPFNKQQLRYAVFADLHQRGYFLSSGLKFGGDFLVYPGITRVAPS
jgi:tRNA splicing endonuclease